MFHKRFLWPLQTHGIAANKQLYQETEPQCANFLTMLWDISVLAYVSPALPPLQCRTAQWYMAIYTNSGFHLRTKLAV